MTTMQHQCDPVLYIDCTASLHNGMNTGIQRVVWALASQANVFTEVLGVDCVLIAYKASGFYRFTLEAPANLQPVEFARGDIYLCLDSFWSMDIYTRYPFLRERGVFLVTLIYDLIPIMYQDFVDIERRKEFENALSVIIKNSRLLPCISRATRRDLLSYCSEWYSHVQASNCPIIPLAPGIQMPRTADDTSKRRLPSKPFFLMVGSIEPRRGYRYTLRELRRYWANGGANAALIIGRLAGNGEIVVEDFVAAIQEGLPLYWLADAEDYEVAAAYQCAKAVICSSRAEGYGMSVSEGLAYNGLVLANRLPVFLEFAGLLPYYFDVDVAGDLSQLLDNVDMLVRRRQSVAGMGTWEDTARMLAVNLAKIDLSPSG